MGEVSQSVMQPFTSNLVSREQSIEANVKNNWVGGIWEEYSQCFNELGWLQNT